MKSKKYPYLIIVFLISTFSTAFSFAKITTESFKKEHVPNQLIIKYKNSIHQLSNSILSNTGAYQVKTFTDSKMSVFEFPENTNLSKISYELQDLSEIEFVELNHYHYLQEAPNDPSFSKQYGLNNKGQSGGSHDADIDAPEAWSITKGSRKVLIGVIDTGVEYSHPDIINNYWVNPGENGVDKNGNNKRNNGIDDDNNGYVDDYKGWDFYNTDNDPTDGHGHGTHCAGIIGARGNNQIGMTGVNWETSIVGLKIFSDKGKTRSDAIISAIEYASALNIPITNNSWGSYTYSPGIRSAILNATRRGMLFVAAAGNYSGNNNTKPFYPASYKITGVLSVGATDKKDQLTSFSNYGSESVDVAAPGNRIYSTIHRGRYSYKNGTSMAAPFVAGIAGLLKAQKPNATAFQMKQAIVNSGDEIPALEDVVESGKRVNAHRALRAL